MDLRAELKRGGHRWGIDRLNAAKRELGPALEKRGPNKRDVRWQIRLGAEKAGADAG